METVKLNNGILMPRTGFGTWKISQSQATESVSFALKSGYRLIDTAKIYGNEEQVGQGIKASGLPREDIFLTTKLWNGDQGYEAAHEGFERSLARLGSDYIDLYLLHWPVTNKRLDSWRALEEIVKTDKLRAIGVSNFTVRHLEELIKKTHVVPVVNQVEFHPFLYDEQKPLLEYCESHGIVLEAYSPLAHASRMHDPVITKLAEAYRKSNAQILLRWALQQGTVPIPKSTNQARIIENLDIFDFEITNEDTQAINSLSDGTRTCGDPNEME